MLCFMNEEDDKDSLNLLGLNKLFNGSADQYTNLRLEYLNGGRDTLKLKKKNNPIKAARKSRAIDLKYYDSGYAMDGSVWMIT